MRIATDDRHKHVASWVIEFGHLQFIVEPKRCDGHDLEPAIERLREMLGAMLPGDLVAFHTSLRVMETDPESDEAEGADMIASRLSAHALQAVDWSAWDPGFPPVLGLTAAHALPKP